MPLIIVRNDITKMEADAIVNAANPTLLGGGGVDGAIHKAAGPELYAECKPLGGCKTGQAKITKGYRLPAKYVIHTVGPVYQDGKHGEKALLSSCYKNALLLAKENALETVAFPLISAGVYGYPKAEAIKVAIDAITEFLIDNDMTVYLVVFSRDVFEITGKLFNDVQAYIDDVYVDSHTDSREALRQRMAQRSCMYQPSVQTDFDACATASMDDSLDDLLNQIDESFSEMLIRKIDEKQMTNAECYKKANVDRRLFNKIKNNPAYKPAKQTVLAFAIALELTLDEARDMLMKAGFALSHSNKADIVVEYCLKTRNYNIIEINQILFKLDLQPLGY